jgi:heat shock protein HslJ
MVMSIRPHTSHRAALGSFTSRRIALVAAIALLPVLGAACGDPDTEPAATDPTAPAATTTTPATPATPAAIDLDGIDWLAVGSTGVTLVDGARVLFSFADGSLSVSGGCNTMFGGYQLDGDTLVVDAMASTEMACEQPLMDQDQALSAFLASRPTVDVSGDTLTLTGDAGVIELQDREVADPDRPLEGTTWRLDSVVTNDAATAWADVEPTLTIDGTAASWALGCNTGVGDVTVDGDTITFGPVGVTKMACEGNAAEVEAAILGVITAWETAGTTVTWEINADQLTLSNGTDGLTFVEAD